jgi:hypothetical protein
LTVATVRHRTEVTKGPGSKAARAVGDDGAGEVPAQAGTFRLVDQPHGVEEAACDREVDGVDRRGGDPNPGFSGPGLHDGNLDDLDRIGSARSADDGGAEGRGTHGVAPRDGLVTRTVTPTVPVTVTYELTDLGLSLHHVMRDIKEWAEAHMDDVLANREEYDTRVA